MAEEINAGPLLKEIDTLKKSVEKFSIDLNETLGAKQKKLKSLSVRSGGILRNTLAPTLSLYRVIRPKTYRIIEDTFLCGVMTGFRTKIQEIISKIEAIDKELQGKKKILQEKLKEVEEIREVILTKSLEANQPEPIHDAQTEAVDPLDEWYRLEQATTNFINDSRLSIKTMSLQADSEFPKLDNIITRLEGSLKEIIDDIHEFDKILNDNLGSRSQPENIKALERKIQNATVFTDLIRETRQINKEDYELNEPLQKTNDEFELQSQKLSNKQAKKEEKLKSLQKENENYLEEIVKRDKLLHEKNLEIEELRHELKKYRELKNTQEQTEAKLVKVEEMQKFNMTITQEKDIQIEELKEFTKEIYGLLNKSSELNNIQDDDLQVKEESGLENEMKYLKEASSLEEGIPEEAQQKGKTSLREVSESHSVNGKRNLDSLLANCEEDYEIKSTSKDLSPRENLKNGKENVEEVFSEKDDKDLEGIDQVMKKIKQE